MNQKNKMKKQNNQNLAAKIMSVVIAILLWSYVMTIENPDERKVIRNIRVKFLNSESLMDSGNQLMSPEQQFVNVTLRGKKNELDKVIADMISATVDLEGYGPGSKRIPIDVNLEGISNLVNVEGISPNSLLVNIDSIVTRDFEVRVDTKGNPKENYMTGEYQISSPKVQVTGAASQIGNIESIRTSIDIEAKDKGFTVTNPLYALGVNGEKLSNITMKPDVVAISVPIYKTVVVPIEPATFGSLPVDYATTKMTVNPPTVSLKIIDDSVALPKTIKTEPINMEELVNSDEKMLNLVIPEGIEAIDNSQNYTLNYQIQKYIKRTFAVSKMQIKFDKLPQDMVIDENSITTIVDVTVRGYEKELKDMSASQINLTVDLENAVEGENVFNLKLNPDENSSISLVGTPQIKIEIHKKNKPQETIEEPREENDENIDNNEIPTEDEKIENEEANENKDNQNNEENKNEEGKKDEDKDENENPDDKN